MKPSASLLFSRLLSLSSVITLTVSASAAPIIWTGATGGSWALATNWNPNAIPGSGDIATFNIATAPITINLNGNQEVAGLSTPATGLTNVHTLLGGGTDRTLTIGASGIVHLRGGITIGSGTAGQKVDVLLAAGQTWDSSRSDGTGSAQALFINNNVALKSGLGAQTLTLTGTNTGSYVNGVISNDAGSTLSIVKNGTGTWAFNGANTYGGTTQINAGMLRLGAVGTLAPSSVSVAAGATLGFRVNDGTNGFTTAEIDSFIAGVNFTAGALIAFDTANASATATSTYSGNYTSNIPLLKTGGNNLTLTGNNAPAGGFTVSGGGAIVDNGSSLAANTTINSSGSLILNTSSSLTGTVVVNGGGSLILSAPAPLGATVTVNGSGAIIARAGSNFTDAQITALRINPNVTLGNTAYFGISTFNGDYSYGTVLPDGTTTRFTKAEANTLFLTAQNTYSGGTQITGGILSVTDIKNGGLISQMGRSSNVTNGIILGGGRLQYAGAGATTDRLFNLTANSAIESSGTGALVFNNTGAIATEGNSRNLILTGYNRNDNRMGVNLVNGTNVTSIQKNGFGKWILSGNNTYTGSTTVRGGTLVLDYTGGKAPIAATAQVLVQNGTAEFMGSGTKTIGSLNLSEGENGFGVAKVSGGMNLTATTLLSGGASQRMVLIDLSGTGNQLSFGTLGSNLTNTASGNLLMTSNSRANIIVRANDGSYGFAAAAATTNSTVEKLAGQTAVAAGTFSNVTSDTTNYVFNSAAGSTTSYTSGSSLKFQTLTFDSSLGGIDVNFAAGHTFNGAGNGRALLFTGSHDVNFSGPGGNIAQSSIWFNNYLEDSAQLNISSPLTGGFLIVGGTGFTNYTGTGLAASEFVLNGGLFRVGANQNFTGTYRINNAIVEVGGSLSNGGAVDLNQTTGNFRLTGDAGFSAFGATRTVSLGTDVTWGASNFLVNTSGEDGDHAFRLSSTRSNATVDFKSNINLNGKARTVDVTDGSASVDARLSGNLTGSGIASRLVKSGLGTLELTGTNSYSGITRVEGGRLMVGGGGLTATTSVHVQNSTLTFTAQEVINNAADITLENGIITTASAPETMGRLTLIGDNKLDLVGLGNVIKMAQSSDMVWSSTLSIYNWNGNTGGGGADQFFIGDSQGGVTSNQLSKIFFVDPEVNGVAYTGTFGSSILTTGEIVAMIPEPSASALLAGSALGFVFLRRRRVAAHGG